jgi:hypothetical protein
MNGKNLNEEMASEFFKQAIEAQSTRARDFFLEQAVEVMKSAGIEIAYIKNAAAQVGIK